MNESTQQATGSVILGGAMMGLGGYVSAIFAGAAIHYLKNGPGDGTMPSLPVSTIGLLIGLIMLGVGFALCRQWIKNPDDPVSSFELFSVLICDPLPLCIGFYYLFERRSRGLRLLLTHALILFVKLLVMAIAWNPNL